MNPEPSNPADSAAPIPEATGSPSPYRLVVFWKEDPRTKKTFIQYREIQVAVGPVGEGEEEPAYEFYPLALVKLIDELLLRWKQIDTIPEAIVARQATLEESRRYFEEALEASDNPHCETFVVQTAMNFMTTVDLLFNLVYFAESLPIFFDQATIAKVQQTNALYVWLDPYLGGLSRRDHKPLDTDEAAWPAKDEFYCYFKRKSDPAVSPQQIANIWRTSATRVVEIEDECRNKLWGWLKGQRFSEEEIRALILP